MSNPPPDIKVAGSPWRNLPVSVYMLPILSSPPLLDHAYAPLEANSSFASAESGEFKGGLGMIQIIRYRDTPVGPYDELLLVPGFFNVPGTGGKREKEKSLPRISRIYVSQKDTCWNGRNNWNIPKHLARFSFTTTPDATTVKVFPPHQSSKAFFEVEISAFKYLPAVPISTNWFKYVGIETRLAQPPLPASEASGDGREVTEDERTSGEAYLCGTKEWRVATPEVSGKGACCWVTQQNGEGPDAHGETTPLLSAGTSDQTSTKVENEWWPNYAPWKIGVWIEDGRVSFVDSHEPGIGAKI
ncbi:hypothetical protein K402DRAFT_455246 [Aulographum hederae CBS 113979]|uniref:Uncharacterized protein n=1 Tax=Aulographum hederae CBS 113979 TaxID=1176131 RepID=A0A6G1GWG8_9PEZI|nr:hypothetical protein K402DRAFT_455246 [Aulographum hederae CBS 113979]